MADQNSKPKERNSKESTTSVMKPKPSGTVKQNLASKPSGKNPIPGPNQVFQDTMDSLPAMPKPAASVAKVKPPPNTTTTQVPNRNVPTSTISVAPSKVSLRPKSSKMKGQNQSNMNSNQAPANLNKINPSVIPPNSTQSVQPRPNANPATPNSIQSVQNPNPTSAAPKPVSNQTAQNPVPPKPDLKPVPAGGAKPNIITGSPASLPPMLIPASPEQLDYGPNRYAELELDQEHVYAILRQVIIADADRHAIILMGGNTYFPPECVHHEFLKETNHYYTYHGKGTAHYFDVTVAGKTNRGAAWMFIEPSPTYDILEGFFAFWRGVNIA